MTQFLKKSTMFEITAYKTCEIGLLRISSLDDPSHETQNICIPFVQCWAGPTLYKCYTNVLCLRWTFIDVLFYNPCSCKTSCYYSHFESSYFF